MNTENINALLISVLKTKDELRIAQLTNDYSQIHALQEQLLFLTAALVGDKMIESLIDCVSNKRGVA